VFAREQGVISRGLLQRWALFLGSLSYSLYMVHVFVVARGMDGLRLIGLSEVTLNEGAPLKQIVAAPWLADLLGIGLIAACLPVAWLAWRFLEWPARAWSRRRAARMGVGAEERVAPTV
jgi:peptidoglycan/LPS O-acetylase OafA/YrhL